MKDHLLCNSEASACHGAGGKKSLSRNGVCLFVRIHTRSGFNRVLVDQFVRQDSCIIEWMCILCPFVAFLLGLSLSWIDLSHLPLHVSQEVVGLTMSAISSATGAGASATLSKQTSEMQQPKDL